MTLWLNDTLFALGGSIATLIAAVPVAHWLDRMHAKALAECKARHHAIAERCATAFMERNKLHRRVVELEGQLELFTSRKHGPDGKFVSKKAAG